MASFHKPVAEIIPGMMSLGLAGRAIKMIPKDIMSSSKMVSKDDGKLIKKKQTKDFIKGSTEILIGIPLIGAVAGSVAKL